MVLTRLQGPVGAVIPEGQRCASSQSVGHADFAKTLKNQHFP
jgi:hypothetical protein